MKIVIFDTETTGLLLPSTVELQKQPRIIELGIAVVEDRKLTAEYNWLIYPEEQITEEITKITGIKNEDLQVKPLFKDLLPEIESVFKGATFGVAHNAPFDVGMITYELERINHTSFPWPDEVLCSAQEYTALMGFRPRMVDLYKHIIGSELKQTHRALDDALALYEILSKDGFFDVLEQP